MNQFAEATRPRPPSPPGPGSGSGSGPETSNLTSRSLTWQTGSLSLGTVVSNPFSDSHGISSMADVSVDDLNRVEVSTYHEDTTGGRL
jgi:hypothetical protein